MLDLKTGLTIKRGENAGQPLCLGDIIKGNQTHEVVVKQKKDGTFVGKILNAGSDYGKELEQDLTEFLNAWSSVKIIGNINVID